MARPKLLLFDIDGTMLRTTGVGRRTIEQVLSDLCERPINTNPVLFSGKTDPQILRDVMQENGVPKEDVEAILPTAMAAYVEAALPFLIPENIIRFAGVPELLDLLAPRPGLHLGVLTGNLEPTAYGKLEAAAIDHFFPFGSFGSDSANRNDLLPIALERARAHTQQSFEMQDVILIGDTEHDVRCARAHGATIACVCTGHFDRPTLAALEPDVLLDDLRDAALFMRDVLGEA